MFETTAASTFDSQKAEAFAGRLLGGLNSGALCLMTSIGHRTGLFDDMRDQPPMTFGDIAARAGLNEGYTLPQADRKSTSPLFRIGSRER